MSTRLEAEDTVIGENANKISVISASDVPVTVSYSYAQETGYEAAGGSFTDGTDPVTSKIPRGIPRRRAATLFWFFRASRPKALSVKSVR